MFIPKTPVILTVSNREQDPPVIPTRYFTVVTVTKLIGPRLNSYPLDWREQVLGILNHMMMIVLIIPAN